MGKTSLIMAGIMALCLVFSCGAWAGDAGKVGLGVRLSGVNVQDDKINDPAGNRYNLTYDQTAEYGINGTYFFLKDFALELGAEYVKLGADAGLPSEVQQGFANITQVPIFLTFRFQPTISDRWMPYAGVGLGYYFNSADAKEPGMNLDMDNCVGYHLNTGVELMLKQASAINFDLQYRWARSQIKEQETGWIEHLDLNAWTFGVGYKYYF